MKLNFKVKLHPDNSAEGRRKALRAINLAVTGDSEVCVLNKTTGKYEDKYPALLKELQHLHWKLGLGFIVNIELTIDEKTLEVKSAEILK